MHQSPSQQQIGKLTGGQGGSELMGNSEAQTAMLKYQLPVGKASDKLAELLHEFAQPFGSFCPDWDHAPACPARKLIEKQYVYVHTSNVSHAP